MSIIIRLQNLPLEANSLDIRRFFHGLQIPDGGVHIVGGENGDAFIAFANDEDARQAMERNGNVIKGSVIKLLLSSRNEMHRIIDAARNQTISIIPTQQQQQQQPPSTAAPTAASTIKSMIPGSKIPQQQQQPSPQQTIKMPPSQQQQQQQPTQSQPSFQSNFQQFPNPMQQQQQQQSSNSGGYYPSGNVSASNVGFDNSQQQLRGYPLLTQSSSNDFHRSNFKERQNERSEIQFRGRSRSRSPPPIKDANNTMQTGLIRSLQQQSSQSSNYAQQSIGNDNNIDSRYSNYQPQPPSTQQPPQDVPYRQMAGASNNQMDNNNSGGGYGGMTGMVGQGIGMMQPPPPSQQQQQQRDGPGGVGIKGWNTNNNNNNNDNYRQQQTSVIDSFNDRKMDSIHHPPQQQQSTSLYGQQQQPSSTAASAPQPLMLQQPPPPQQMFTLQLNDLPLNIKSNDLIKFFDPLYLDEDNIKIFYDAKGFPTGIALVRFSSPKEWEHALLFNNRFIGDRRIQVRPLDDANVPSNINQNQQQPLLQPPLQIQQGQQQQQHPQAPLISNPPGSQQRFSGPPPPSQPPIQSDQYRSTIDNYSRNSAQEDQYRHGPPPPPPPSILSQQFNGNMGPSPPPPPPHSSSPKSSSHVPHYLRGKYQPRCKENSLFMKGLPFANCTTRDVAQFFEPINLYHIEIEYDQRKKPTGNAFVEFYSPQDVDHAMSYNMRNMGHRYIELIPWLLYEKYGPQYHLPSAPPPPKFMRGNRGPPPPPPPSHSPYGGGHRSGGSNHHHHHNSGQVTYCVIMRNLGRHVETPDIKQFFQKSNINSYAVHIMLTSDKKNAGEAFVEFLTKSEQQQALDLNGQRLCGDYVTIQPISYDVVRANVPTPPPPPPSSFQSSSSSSKSSHHHRHIGGGPPNKKYHRNNNHHHHQHHSPSPLRGNNLHNNN